MALIKHVSIRNKALTTPHGQFRINNDGVVITRDGNAEIPGKAAAYLINIPGYQIDRIEIKTETKQTPEAPVTEKVEEPPQTVEVESEPAAESEQAEAESTVNYESLSLPQLKALARQRNIEFAKNAGKKKMINLLT